MFQEDTTNVTCVKQISRQSRGGCTAPAREPNPTVVVEARVQSGKVHSKGRAHSGRVRLSHE